MPKNRTKNSPRPVVEEPYIKDFLDMVAPSVIDFKVDHYLCGNTCRCVHFVVLPLLSILVFLFP